MSTYSRIYKKIYVILLAVALVYGTFFPVAAGIAFAEDTAQDAATKIEAAASKGDTSDSNKKADTNGDATGVTGEGSGDKTGDQSIDKSGDQSVGESGDKSGVQPGAQLSDENSGSIEGDQGGLLAKSAAGAQETQGLGTDGQGKGDGSVDTHKALPGGEPVGEKPGPAEEEPVNDKPGTTRAVLTINDDRTYIEYTHELDIDGTVILKDFFYVFEEDAFGTEFLTIMVDYGLNCISCGIEHYSDGTWLGTLPEGFRIEKNDLLISNWWVWPNTYVNIFGEGLISGIYSEPEGAFYEPEEVGTLPAFQEPESSEPEIAQAPVIKKTKRAGNTGNKNSRTVYRAAALPASTIVDSIVEEDVEKDDPTDNDAVFSSFNNSNSSANVKDATRDSDSPINATTAMLAGVAAMFMISIALVVVPKV